MRQKIDLPALEIWQPDPANLTPLVRVFGELSLHADGELLALAFVTEDILCSVEEPGVLRRWNVSTGRPLGSAFLSDVETLWAFSADGSVLMSASDKVSLWDTTTGQLIGSVAQPSWVDAVALGSKPALLATGHDEGVVRLWDPQTGRRVRELAGHDRPISALAYSPDGQRLASAGEDRIICIWEVDSGCLLGTLVRHTDRLQGLAWHPTGSWLISGAWDRTARVWDTTTFEPVILLNTHADQITALALSPTGETLACADSANTIHIWDPVPGKELHILKEHGDEIRCLAYNPDGRRLASGGADRVIHVWDPHHGQLLSRRGRPVSRPTYLVISPDSHLLASTCGGVQLRVWDLPSGTPCSQFDENQSPEVIAGSLDGRWLASGGGTKIWLWDTATGKLKATLEGQAGKVAALAFAPNSAVLASASASDGTVWLWDTNTGKPILVIPVAADGCTVETIAFHPQGNLLAAGGIDWMATGGSDGAICLWDINQRQPVAALNRGTTRVAFTPCGHRLAAASLNDSICIWDIDTQSLHTELRGHADVVTCVVYSPAGRWLASGSDDRTVRLWSVGTHKLAAVQTLDTQVKALVFSPDGHSLFTGNGNTTSYELDVALLLEAGVAGPAR